MAQILSRESPLKFKILTIRTCPRELAFDYFLDFKPLKRSKNKELGLRTEPIIKVCQREIELAQKSKGQ